MYKGCMRDKNVKEGTDKMFSGGLLQKSMR